MDNKRAGVRLNKRRDKNDNVMSRAMAGLEGLVEVAFMAFVFKETRTQWEKIRYHDQAINTKPIKNNINPF